MHERRIPEWLRHAPAPSVRGFAMLAAAEAVARGILISVFPLRMYQALQDAALVSQVYFLIGIASLLTGLLVPFLARFLPRRWVYMSGASCFIAGSLLATDGSVATTVAGLMLTSMATVTTFVCFNAYVLDYIAKIELGRCETSRMFYSAAGWTAGPVLGVTLLRWWEPAPFLVAATASLTMLLMFLAMRLGNGKLITKSRRAPTNPLGFLPRFFAQPRLVAGWLFAVIRSCGWWVYVVYLPIFAIQSGLGEQLGGIALSVSNAALFVTPFMLRFMQRYSIRHAVRTGFLMAGVMFGSAAVLSGLPWLTVLCLMTGSFFLILLDVSAGLPFPACRQTLRTDRNVRRLFQLPGCIGHPHPRRGMACPACGTLSGNLWRGRRRTFGSMVLVGNSVRSAGQDGNPPCPSAGTATAIQPDRQCFRPPRLDLTNGDFGSIRHRMTFVRCIQCFQNIAAQGHAIRLEEMRQLISGCRTKDRRRHKGSLCRPCKRHQRHIKPGLLRDLGISIDGLEGSVRPTPPEIAIERHARAIRHCAILVFPG